MTAPPSPHTGGSTIDRLFLDLRSFPEAEWEERLAERGVAPAVRGQVLELLREDREFQCDQRMAAEWSPDAQVGGYPLLAVMGRGGFGQVFRTLQPPGGFAALKVFRPDPTRNGCNLAAARVRFENEVSILA